MSKPCILVTGGAGYIGAHFCRAASMAGFAPVVLDRISSKSSRVEAYRRECVKSLPLEVADIGDKAALRKIIDRYKPTAAIHFAALTEIEESIANPNLYWENNFEKTRLFFEVLEETNVNKVVFSSTAAVYGNPRHPAPLMETDGLTPINPYGATKLGGEVMLQNPATSALFSKDFYTRAPQVKHFPKLRSVILRYFNAAGSDGTCGEIHDPETHLIPNALFAAEGLRDYGKGKAFTVYGTDYPTPDGTAVRDYIHINDLVGAHILGLNYLMKGGGSDIFNIGSGQGYSVKDVVETVRQVTKRNFDVKYGERRAGDPPMLVADITKARKILNWTPKTALPGIIESAWHFHREHG
jgi:UDP-glucose-4-epimerase GalE